MITVEEWGGPFETDETQSLSWLGGWFNFGKTRHRWKDYLDNFNPVVHPYLEAVRQSVLEHHYRFGGDRHQDGMEPKFSDGKVLSLSFRAWGDLMAAIWSEQEDKDYSYMDFYMGEG